MKKTNLNSLEFETDDSDPEGYKAAMARFASGEAGNPLTPAEQEAKLRLVGAVARRVWP